MRLSSRKEAGLMLAERLAGRELREPLVLALPRGGVPVAYEIARSLGAELDVLVVRKIGAPHHEELGIGAVTEGGYYWIDPELRDQVEATNQQIERTLIHEKAELRRRLELYRGSRPLPQVKNRSVIVVDDGLATGVTARVACAYLRREGANEVILAVPVCSPRTAAAVREEVDEFICLEEPRLFLSVGQFYEDFRQTSDEEVLRLLGRSRLESKEGA